MGERESRGVALGPQPSDAVVLLAVLQVLRGDAADERIGRVAVGQQRTDGEQHFRDGQRRRPVVF